MLHFCFCSSAALLLLHYWAEVKALAWGMLEGTGISQQNPYDVSWYLPLQSSLSSWYFKKIQGVRYNPGQRKETQP